MNAFNNPNRLPKLQEAIAEMVDMKEYHARLKDAFTTRLIRMRQKAGDNEAQGCEWLKTHTKTVLAMFQVYLDGADDGLAIGAQLAEKAARDMIKRN